MTDRITTGSTRLPRWRRFVVGLVAFTLAGEIGVRLWDGLVVEGTVGSLLRSIVQREDYWTLTPDTTIVQPERGGDVAYRINRAGFRGREPDPSYDGTTIVFLGDSVTFGLGAGEDDTFPRRAESLLAERLPGRPLRAVSLSVFAYSPVNEAVVLERYGWPAKPAMVVLQLYMNDFYLGRAQDGSPAAASAANRLRAAAALVPDGSALYRRIRQAAQATTFRLFHRARRERYPETLNAIEPEWNARLFAEHPDDADFESFGVIERMHAESIRRGVPFLVVLTPNEVQLFNDRFDAIGERVARFCAAKGIPFADSLPTLRAHPQRVDLFHDGLHLSALGNRVLAEWLAPIIEAALREDRPVS